MAQSTTPEASAGCTSAKAIVTGEPPICVTKACCEARNLVERFFNRIKQFRRIATCYDKLAENFLAAVKLASIRIRLRDE
jgi:transposase